MSDLNSCNKPDAKVFSIGHSNLTAGSLILLLKLHYVDVLVDVRSHPYSRFAPQFNKNNVKYALEAEGIKYGYSGKTLGGRPESTEFYDSQGHVLYSALASSSRFKGGIQRLKKGIYQHRIALMCSEEDPKDCHRRLLIGRVLEEQGIAVEHIRANGRVQTEDQLKSQVRANEAQLSLLPSQEGENWRSVRPIRSVLPSTEPPTSLRP